MSSAAAAAVATSSEPITAEPITAPIQAHIEQTIEDLLASLPDATQLPAEARRGILARYTAVLEGNFIYWMTGAYLAVGTDVARDKIIDNLREEVRDSHPHMLRRHRGNSRDCRRQQAIATAADRRSRAARF